MKAGAGILEAVIVNGMMLAGERIGNGGSPSRNGRGR